MSIEEIREEEIDKAGLIAENAKLQKQVDLLTYGLLLEKNKNTKLREALAKINTLNANKDNDITWLIEQALKAEEQDNEQHKG